MNLSANRQGEQSERPAVRSARHVHLRQPLPADPAAEPAEDGAVGQALVIVLPAVHAEHLVEAVLDRPGVDVGGGQGAVAAAL
jgi:hypothetical protein